MKYFLIETRFGYPATDPIDEAGRFVEFVGVVKPWNTSITFVTVPRYDQELDVSSAEFLPDILTAGLDWLASERLVRTLREARLDPEVGFLPATVRNRAGIVLGTYYLVYSRVSHNVLDVKRSGAQLLDGGAIDEISRWVLDRALLPEWDLFFAHYFEWIASERIRSLVQAGGFRRVRFRKLSCVTSEKRSGGDRFVRLDQ